MLWFSLLHSRRLSSTFIDFGAQIKRLNDTKQFQKAIDLFDTQVEQQTQPTTLAINQALKACIELRDYKRGSAIHQNLLPNLSNNDFIRTSLIRLYMKCGEVAKGKELFFKSAKKTIPMYNTMLTGLIDNGRAKEALDLFRQMSLPPNEYTFNAVFKMCAQLADEKSLEFGKMMFEKMPTKFQNNQIVLNSILHMFMRCGEISSGEELFSKMEKNIISHGTMMAGYVSNKMPQKAIDHFLKIEKIDEIIYTLFFNSCAQLGNKKALILGKKVFSQLSIQDRSSNDLRQSIFNMFIKCDDEEQAVAIFARLNRTIFDYGSLMKMYNLKHQSEKTLNLFEQMKKEKIEPNPIIFVLLIDACSEIGDVQLCQSIIEQIPLISMSDPWIQIALVDMWGKVGSANEAKLVFDTIDQVNNVAFSAMINAYGRNGMGMFAIELFRKVPFDMLDNWIYVCVLNACSHCGQIKEAQEIFDKIPIEMRTEKIYTTMVDALSRSHLFDQAQQLMDKFEKCHSPSIHMYMAILSGARNNKNVFLSKKIFDRIQLLFPRATTALVPATVLLANTYAAHGNFSKASDIRGTLNQSNMKKITGLSWTFVDGKIVKFRAQDRSHPRSPEIYAELDQLMNELVEHGYQCDPSWITRPLMNDETNESVLHAHSERLAIAFNLIQRPIRSRIQVVKNLRVCGDCHTVIKMIAQIRRCLIVVRDANRIHHFHPEGQCSCGDRF